VEESRVQTLREQLSEAMSRIDGLLAEAAKAEADATTEVQSSNAAAKHGGRIARKNANRRAAHGTEKLLR
jgi:hypothetical protein